MSWDMQRSLMSDQVKNASTLYQVSIMIPNWRRMLWVDASTVGSR
jgi:hypothetical protein